MTARTTLAVSRRVLLQLRRDHRSLAMLLALPSVLLALLWWMYSAADTQAFDRAAPALLAVFPVTVMFLVASVTTLRERSSGTLERLMSMPLSRLDFVLGYALAFGLLATLQAILAVTISVQLLGLQLGAGLVPVLVGAIVNAVLGMALGLLVSAFAESEFQAVQFLPAVVLPQVLLCGLFVPRSDLPSVLHVISDLLPMSYAVDAMRLAAQGGDAATLTRDLLIVAGFVVVSLALGAASIPRRTP